MSKCEQPDYIDALKRAAGNWARSDAENRELRELTADMYKTIDGLKAKIEEWLPCTDFCPRWKNDCSDLSDADCWYESRMRELGIEVAVSCEPIEAKELESWESIFKENDFLQHECGELRELIGDMHALLQRCCDETNIGECSGQPSRCAMWSDPNDDCDLRKIEERMRTLGIEVRE